MTAAAVLTGEDWSAKGVTPQHPIDPVAGDFGAVELAGRFATIDLDVDTFRLGYANAARSARHSDAWGVGLNWYLHRYVKVTVDFERSTFTAGAPTGADRPAENLLATRLQQRAPAVRGASLEVEESEGARGVERVPDMAHGDPRRLRDRCRSMNASVARVRHRAKIAEIVRLRHVRGTQTHPPIFATSGGVVEKATRVSSPS